MFVRENLIDTAVIRTIPHKEGKVLGIRQCFEFVTLFGVGWTVFQCRIANLVGFCPNWYEFSEGRASYRKALMEFHRFQLIVEGKDTFNDVGGSNNDWRGPEATAEWQSLTDAEQRLVEALGYWHPKSYYQSFVQTRKGADVKGWSSQGFNDPIPYPGFTIWFDPELVLAAALECGYLGEPNPEVEASIKRRTVEAEHRRREREEREKAERAEWDRKYYLRCSLADRAIPVLQQALPHIVNWSGFLMPGQTVQVTNLNESTGECWLALEWEDRTPFRRSHSVFVETTTDKIEEAAHRIVSYFQEGNQVEDLFIHLKDE